MKDKTKFQILEFALPGCKMLLIFAVGWLVGFDADAATPTEKVALFVLFFLYMR